MIAATDRVWKLKFAPDGENADPFDLAGFYEEFKSTYNKLPLACKGKNYENAYNADMNEFRQRFLHRAASRRR